MKSNFNEKLRVSADGRTVTVGGPLFWSDDDPDNAKIEEIAVTVIQGEGDDATYASGSWKISYQSTNKSWGPFQLTVDADDKPFSPGKALAAGGVLFSNGPGEKKWWPWPDAVKLRDPSASPRRAIVSLAVRVSNALVGRR